MSSPRARTESDERVLLAILRAFVSSTINGFSCEPGGDEAVLAKLEEDGTERRRPEDEDPPVAVADVRAPGAAPRKPGPRCFFFDMLCESEQTDMI